MRSTFESNRNVSSETPATGKQTSQVASSGGRPESRSPLLDSAQFVKGVGPARFELLKKLGIETVGDLLFYFPRTYENLSNLRSTAQLREGEMQTVRGEVVAIEGREISRGRCLVSIVLDDGHGCIEGVWFNQPFAARKFRYGQLLSFSGKPKWYRDHWQMSNPRVHILDDAQAEQPPPVLPIYRLTENLRAEQLQPIIRRAVEQAARYVEDFLPSELKRRRGFPSPEQALRAVHMPASIEEGQAGRRRFVYEEFLLLQVALAVRRRELRDRRQAPRLVVTKEIDQRIRRLFPFELTADQNRAVAAICRDLQSDRPMQRLLQADVGAGKTAVAVYALLAAVANKYQAVLMAPTEVLARQHWQTLSRYLAHSRVRRLLLTGALSGRERRTALAEIRNFQVDLVIGTQALVQQDVQFAQLGLVVIDEQHKFGVHQRARIRKMGVDPHYLVMTATPIPRTIALTMFGDLDLTVIKQLPPGRQPVRTKWVSEAQREQIYEQVRSALRQGRQAYVICPLVNESENLELKSAETTFRELQQGPFREFEIGLLHGRLDDKVKETVMDRFRRRELDVLVSTSVVEVGVDVPNATIMLIEHADHFGLSQLHQLRGRISRGTIAGQCFLFGEPTSDEARQRLKLFTRTSDGFTLAEEDARLRGAGELFGARQHGLGELRFGDLLSDSILLQWAREDALALVRDDPGLRKPEHALLRRAVIERYGQTLDLAEIG
ncbi:MAG: ATP-dependent DNA helicase RecG [Gemmatales bacterium]|nr:MAG: ATP-dependent DNA helicase RecG [Gemmatales bacterium]